MRPILISVMCFLLVAKVQAGLFDDDVARKGLSDLDSRIEQVRRSLEDRLVEVERVIKGTALPDLLNQVEDLKTDLAKLRGQLEVVNYELAQINKKQKDLYLDLDVRIRKMEDLNDQLQKDRSAQSSASGAATADVERPSEEKAYEVAYDLFKAGRYTEAVTAFHALIQSYPKSVLVPSAQYWMGNAYYSLREYQNAIQVQRKLVLTYPDSQKAPDALLNMASAQIDLGKAPEARRSLEELIAKYPLSSVAEKAKQRLNALKKKK